MEWRLSTTPVQYEEALAFMEQRVEGIIAGQEEECIWLLEHPPLYTAGTSAKPADLLDKNALPVYDIGRGGEYTYHGPGQLVAYVMLDLKKLFAPSPPDLRAYIQYLEQWIIRSLSEFDVEGTIREGMIGVWVRQKTERTADSTSAAAMSSCERQEARSGNINKVAAIGVRVRKWVSFHGLCINVSPDLTHYQGIVPCGISEFGVTSLETLGISADIEEMKKVLKKRFKGLH